MNINGQITPGFGLVSTLSSNLTFKDNVKLQFGTGGDSEIFYDGIDTFWNLRVVGSGDLMIALAAGFPSPDAQQVHIWKGGAGSVTANPGAGLTIEDSSNIHIQFLAPDTATSIGILIGKPTGGNNVANFVYNSNSNRWQWRIDGALRLRYSPAAFAFQEATTISTTAGALTFSPATRVVFTKPLNLGSPGSLTIASGAVAITGPYHTLVVEGGAGSGADSLATATGGVDGDLLILKTTTSGANDQVTISDGTGSDTFILAGGADFIMDHIDDRLELIHNSTEWVERSRSSNS